MEVAIFIPDRPDFTARKVIRDKEWHYVMIKESIFQEDITVLNEYTANNRALKYMRQKVIELQGE